jgi:hypothetical protein
MSEDNVTPLNHAVARQINLIKCFKNAAEKIEEFDAAELKSISSEERFDLIDEIAEKIVQSIDLSGVENASIYQRQFFSAIMSPLFELVNQMDDNVLSLETIEVLREATKLKIGVHLVEEAVTCGLLPPGARI